MRAAMINKQPSIIVTFICIFAFATCSPSKKVNTVSFRPLTGKDWSFEKSNVVHMGDVFVRYGFPFIDEPNGGNVNGMIETIDSVIHFIDEKTIIIPGHGQIAGKQDLINYNNMIRTVRDRVKKLMDEGKSLGEIITADPMKDFPKQGVSLKDFIAVVYNSILKSKKE